MRLIDADALKEKFQECINSITVSDPFITGVKNGDESAGYWIDEAPTVEERKQGHWIELEPDKYGNFIQCSVCDSKFGLYSKDNYCQACGAIMDGEAGGV